jgi:hypothetical protein
VQRPLLKQILDQRRKSVAAFASEIPQKVKASQEICKWYPFVWCLAIFKSNGATSSPIVPII